MGSLRDRLGAALAALLICTAIGAAEAADPDAATRATMGQIFEALSYVLPLSLSDERFEDPARRKAITKALRELADNGARLEAHARSRDAGFGFLSGSLARDSREILARYEAGRIPEARFLLHQVTDNCVACHSRLPDDRAHPLGSRLMRDEAVAALPLDERARLETATRQFDRALSSHEALFASTGSSPADVDLMGHFDDYLEICIRVQQDPKRPIPVFEKLAQRPDIPEALRENLKLWIVSLRELSERKPARSPLAEARALLATARDRSRFPDDRRALVYYVAASSVLHRYVAERTVADAKVGEAYYLLGVIESHVGRSFWLSQTEHYLDTAIRIAPGAPYAPEAYALLEEFVKSGHTGSAGAPIPPDLRQRLRELGALIDSAQGA